LASLGIILLKGYKNLRATLSYGKKGCKHVSYFYYRTIAKIHGIFPEDLTARYRCGIFFAMPVSTPATRSLDSLSISYRIFEHQHPPESLEQAARERGQVPGQVLRSILFRYQKGDFFMTLVAGPEQVSWRKLRAYLGVSRISIATEEEVLAVTGYAIGTVSPLGLQRPIRILADSGVLIPQEISLGSGVRGVAIIMNPADLKRMLWKIEVGQFC
jgi:Cys-tRNA(Pro) deacylase